MLTAERRGRITAATRQRLAGFLQDLPITLDDEMTTRLWTAVASLAAHHRLTAYDAVYLALELRLRLILVTGDRALLAAAIEAEVELPPVV